ncbi:MAG: glycosyltransferase WbuB, partial [Actinomycetales bacterium]|nr:glycosyltransferase WbuB [Actinomycetales bacterium]
MLAYIGIMGPQDGIDVLLRSLAILFHDLGRTDAHAVLMGFGDSMESMRELAVELDLTDSVTFTGRVDARMLGEVLSAAA